jgi:acetyl-CoA carboxylase carboxyltransferase component
MKHETLKLFIIFVAINEFVCMNIEVNRNYDWMRLLVSDVKNRFEKIKLGGGKKSIQKQKEKNKLTARERIDYLLDTGRPFIEIGAFAGFEMYEEQGGCPAGGTVAGIGYISERQCVIVANDQTVKAGAWFPITGKKNLRMQEIAWRINSHNLPGRQRRCFSPMQDEIFPDKEHFGRIFRNNARMSAMGITQIAAVLGACVAGGAYLPIMSDETLMVEGNGNIFLAGPYLVKAAIGEDIDSETLGGAETHNAISGIADYQCKTEQECLDKIKHIIGKLSQPVVAGFNRITSIPPSKNINDIYSIMHVNNAKPYDMVDIIECIVDAGSFEQFKQDYGKTIICGYARIDGWATGIIANQRLIVKTRKPARPGHSGGAKCKWAV